MLLKTILQFLRNFIVCVCVCECEGCFAYIYLCVACVFNASRGQNREFACLELQLQMVMNCHVHTGNRI